MHGQPHIRLIYVSYWILYFSRKTKCSSNIYRWVSLGKSTASVCMYMCLWKFHFNIKTDSEMTFTKPYMLNTVHTNWSSKQVKQKALKKRGSIITNCKYMTVTTFCLILWCLHKTPHCQSLCKRQSHSNAGYDSNSLQNWLFSPCLQAPVIHSYKESKQNAQQKNTS